MKKDNSSDEFFPKFFKVYFPDDSGDDLDIPVSFNSCLPKPLPRNVVVRSIYGNVWKLKLRKRNGDVEKFAMVDGWKRIVKDEDLKGGEFLTFEFDGSRLFNFCIYGHATCKRLGNSVKTQDKSHGEDEKSSVEIIAIDSDDDDDDDDDGDDDDDDADDGGGDDDYDNDDQDSGDEDKDNEDIIVLSDNDDDDDEIKEKGTSEVSQRSDVKDDRQYLNNNMNPFFTVNLNVRRKIDLRMRARVIKDYGLHFPEFINIIDPLETKLGKLKRKVEGHTIKGFESIIRRNKVKSTDKMICELVVETNGLVREIKVHVISG